MAFISKVGIWMILLYCFMCNTKANADRLPTIPEYSDEQHPFLLTTPVKIKQLRRAIQDSSWQSANWLRLKAQADKLLVEEVELPPRAGNWEDYYIDTISGSGLKRGRLIGDWQWEHRNPVSGQLMRSSPNIPSQDYDGVVLSYIHDAWALGVVQLGLAYQLSLDKRYADKARKILLAYARLYPQLPLTNTSRCRNLNDQDFGKTHVQTLDEAIWLIDLVQGADLIWPLLTKQDRQLLQRQLFVPAAYLVAQPAQITVNIVCWENAAAGMVGLLTHNQHFIDLALHHPTRGYTAQVTKNITSDGFWVERSATYHCYALQALITLGQAATNAGYTVDLAPLKKMLDAALNLAGSELTLPAFNDAHTVFLQEKEYLYEWGYAQFHDPTYTAVLNSSKRGKTESRGALFLDWAFVYGEQALPAALPRTVKSLNYPVAGYGLLAKGQGHNSTHLYMEYSPNANGHAHPDQLSFVLFKGAEMIAVDPGINTYGDPRQWNWYRSTAAHNSFMLDYQRQKPSSASCLEFGQAAGADYLMVQTRTAYDSLRFIRTAVMLTENLILFVDQAQLYQPAKYVTIAYHQVGKWLNLPAADSLLVAPKSGFLGLQSPQGGRCPDGVSLLGILPSGRQVRVSTDATVSTDLITGQALRTVNGPVASAYFQRQAKPIMTWAWCVALDGQQIAVQVESLTDNNLATRKAKALLIKLRSAQGKQWEIVVNPDQQVLPSPRLSSRLLVAER